LWGVTLPGMPVATMAIGKAGAKNAALFPLQILPLQTRPSAKNLLSSEPQQKNVIEKDSGLQQNEATQINTIKNLDYPEFNKIGIFWLFSRGDVHFWSKTWLRTSPCIVWVK